MISWYIQQFLTNTICLLLPAYYTYKSIKSKDRKQQRYFLKYWTIIALFNYIELVLNLLISWIPFYFEFKILFVVCMAVPQTKGAIVVYNQYFLNFIRPREDSIDEYIRQISTYVMENMEQLKHRIMVRVYPNYQQLKSSDNNDFNHAPDGVCDIPNDQSVELYQPILKKRKSSKKKSPKSNTLPPSPVLRKGSRGLVC